jgi:hypothetical protein
MSGPDHHTLQIITHGNFFLWKLLKDIVYKNKEHALKELEQGISEAVIGGSKEILAAFVQNLQC